MRDVRRIFTGLAIGLLVSSCAAQSAGFAPGFDESLPGFWWGLLHGLIAPFALIGHVFFNDIRIYATANSGGWYDAGFLTGDAILFGSVALPAYW